MGPCHADKTTRQGEEEKILLLHSKAAPQYAMARSSPISQLTKPKLLFNLLVNDDNDQDEERLRLKSGFLKSFDVDSPNSFGQCPDGTPFNRSVAREQTNHEAFTRQHGNDLEHMAKVEMTRNKLKILLTEPYHHSPEGVATSFSEPVTPPPVRNMLELGKRTNSEGSQYRSLILKKRQKDVMLSPTSKENPSLMEDNLKNKRMKNGFHDISQPNFNIADKVQSEAMPKKQGTSLLKKLLSKMADDEDSDQEYPNISGGDPFSARRLADNRRSLSNSDIYLTSTPTSFLPSPLLATSQPIRRVNVKVRLNNTANDSLFSYLCNSVHYALQLPGFDLLPVDDKRPMIIKAAPRLILLYMAKENYQLETCTQEETKKDEDRGVDGCKPTMDFVESLKLFIKRFQQHQIREEEFSCLKHIALYQYTDRVKPITADDQVRRSLQKAFDDLRDLTADDKSRHSQLLLQLHSLFQLDLKTLETLFFQPLLSSVESLKKLKHLYSDGDWMLDEGRGQENGEVV